MQIFTKMVRGLITTALVAFSFFKEHVLEIMAVAFLVALTIIVVRKVVTSRHQIAAKWYRAKEWLSEKLEASKNARHFAQQRYREEKVVPHEVEKEQQAPVKPVNAEEERAAVRHLNCRITEHIKSVYPTATWDWCGGNPVSIAIYGGTGRISISNSGIFNNADVVLNPLGQLQLTMLQAVKLEQLAKQPEQGGRPEKTEQKAADTSEPEEPAVNVPAWVDLVGRGPLYELSARLFEKGYQKLSINEAGKVSVLDGASEKELASLENMPPMKFWDELAKLLSDESHFVEVKSDRLELGW